MSHVWKRLRFYISWPALYWYFATGERSRVLIVDERGRMLLTQGKWTLWYDDPGLSLPGGGLRVGELPAKGAARELAEELGVAVDPKELRLLGKVRVQEQGIHYDCYMFTATLPSSTRLTLQKSEVIAAAWYTPAELKNVQLKPDVSEALRLWQAVQG